MNTPREPRPGLTYLASPFSHPSPEVREQRLACACRAAASLIRSGWAVFCPIAHLCAIQSYAQVGLGHWVCLEQDLAVLRLCKTLLVLRLEGWEESAGVCEEVDTATKLGIEIIYVDPGIDTPSFRAWNAGGN